MQVGDFGAGHVVAPEGVGGAPNVPRLFADDYNLSLVTAGRFYAFELGQRGGTPFTRRAMDVADDVAGLLAEDKAKELSPTLQAIDSARGFFTLVAHGDTAKIADNTRLPFALGNGVIVTSPKQRDDFFKQASANYRETNQNATLTFLNVTRGEEYLRFADDQERDFFGVVPAARGLSSSLDSERPPPSRAASRGTG